MKYFKVGVHDLINTTGYIETKTMKPNLLNCYDTYNFSLLHIIGHAHMPARKQTCK